MCSYVKRLRSFVYFVLIGLFFSVPVWSQELPPTDYEMEQNVSESVIEERQVPVQDESASSQELYESDVVGDDFTEVAVLRGLDKVTAQTLLLKTKVGEYVVFGNLEMVVYACWHAPQNRNREYKALIRVWEQVPGEQRQDVFFGWVFSSNPALSALEHPVYDVVLVECVSNTQMDDKNMPHEADIETTQ